MRIQTILTALVGIVSLAPARSARAEVVLPDLFSEHMVLQSGTSANVWGWASPGEKVTVTLGSQTQSATADVTGKWKLKLGNLPPGQSGTLTVKGKNTLLIPDVIVGEVWLCAGQSNMAFGVGGQEAKPPTLPDFRVFTEESKGEGEPQEKCKGAWVLCSPETVKQISGTAYFFGKNLHENLKQPVGLIVSAVGGTRIESWTSTEVQRRVPELKPQFDALAEKLSRYNPVTAKAAKEKQLAAFQELVEKAKAAGTRPPNPPSAQYDPRASGPGNLFNAKIAPLIPYTLRGAIWYQGEANAETVQEGRFYGRQLPMLIRDWRSRWEQGDFPFAWVQLPKYQHPKFSGWREVRESMLKALELPNSGMAVMIDTGEPEKIHPNNKRETGRRLSLWALAKVYGQDIAYSGPLPAGNTVRGSEIEVSFKHANDGLTAQGGKPLKGFLIAGDSRVWHPAAARIVGDKVLVSSPEVKSPKAVRYAWENVPDCNLFNGAGLPASPFRTDDWPTEAPAPAPF
jgi:sialate O-acetylesterase